MVIVDLPLYKQVFFYVHMEQKHKDELIAILCGCRLQCSKDFVCFTSGQVKLCKAEDIGLESSLVCLEEEPKECEFVSDMVGDKHFCQCPLRLYIAKKMKK
jgi:hypothetical protein